MVPHGAGVGVYVRGALSGFAVGSTKAKHGLKRREGFGLDPITGPSASADAR